MWTLTIHERSGLYTLEAHGVYIKVLRSFPSNEAAERACAQLERDIADRVEEMLDAYLEQDNEIN